MCVYSQPNPMLEAPGHGACTEGCHNNGAQYLSRFLAFMCVCVCVCVCAYVCVCVSHRELKKSLKGLVDLNKAVWAAASMQLPQEPKP